MLLFCFLCGLSSLAHVSCLAQGSSESAQYHLAVVIFGIPPAVWVKSLLVAGLVVTVNRGRDDEPAWGSMGTADAVREQKGLR